MLYNSNLKIKWSETLLEPLVSSHHLFDHFAFAVYRILMLPDEKLQCFALQWGTIVLAQQIFSKY